MNEHAKSRKCRLPPEGQTSSISSIVDGPEAKPVRQSLPTPGLRLLSALLRPPIILKSVVSSWPGVPSFLSLVTGLPSKYELSGAYAPEALDLLFGPTNHVGLDCVPGPSKSNELPSPYKVGIPIIIIPTWGLSSMTLGELLSRRQTW